jgi:hypothetical protein
VRGDSYHLVSIIPAEVNEDETHKTHEISDEEVTQWKGLPNAEGIPSYAIQAQSVGLAPEENEFRQAEIFQRFAQTVLDESNHQATPVGSDTSDQVLPEPTAMWQSSSRAALKLITNSPPKVRNSHVGQSWRGRTCVNSKVEQLRGGGNSSSGTSLCSHRTTLI